MTKTPSESAFTITSTSTSPPIHSDRHSTMCFGSLAPHSPSTDSMSSSTSQPFPPLSSHTSASSSGMVPHEGSARKRVVRACEVCRRKKVKCNGQKPCAHCIAFGEECAYVDVKDRSAYSRRYVEGLETRIVQLETGWAQSDNRLAHLERELATLLESRVSGSAFQRREGREGMRRASDPGAGSASRLQAQHKHESQEPVQSVGILGKEAETGLDVGCSIDISCLSAPLLIDEAYATLRARNHAAVSTGSSLNAAQHRLLHQASTAQQLSIELDLDNAIEFDSKSTLLSLPAEEDFLALLDSFSTRIYPFCPIVAPSEAHTAWQKATSLPQLPAADDPIAVALVFAVMACGAQTLRSSTAQPARHSALELYRQAKLRIELMSTGMRRDMDALECIQVHTLLAQFSAGLGDAWSGFEHNARAHDLLGKITSSTSEQSWPLRRVYQSARLLDHLIRSLLSKLASRQQDLLLGKATFFACTPESHMFDLFSHLSSLTALCSSSSSVGRTVSDLLHTTPAPDAVNKLKISAQQQETLLQEWYSHLPVAFRASPTTNTDPSSAIGSCIAFVSLQFERLRLHLAVQRFTRCVGGEEESDLVRCMQIAGHTIRAFPIVSQCLPPSPWLALFAQCVEMSAAFLTLTSVRQESCNAVGLMAEVEVAIAGLKQLEGVVQGSTDVRMRLSQLVCDIKARRAEGCGLEKGIQRKRGSEGQDMTVAISGRHRAANTRYRAATMPKIESCEVVSPAARPETAPSIPSALPLVSLTQTAPLREAPNQWPTTNGNGVGTGYDELWHNSSPVFAFPHPPHSQLQGPNTMQTHSFGPNQEAMMDAITTFMNQHESQRHS